MLDGFQYVLAQLGVVVAITALLAGVLGWLIGRGSRRRTEKAFEQAVAAVARPEPDTSMFAPASTIADTGEDSAPPEDESDPGTDAGAEVTASPLTPTQQYGTPLIQHVPLDDIDDPDATVIRPAPISKTAPYLPPAPLITSAPSAPRAALPQPRTSAQNTTSDDAQQLRQELRGRTLELGRIEASALLAWDRMVPQLEQQIDDLLAENDTLRRRIREAEEHSDADALTVERLRSLVADRDIRIAELRAQD